MRILIFTQYFTPEVAAPPTRLHTFARGLSDRGHRVEVVCAVPNHPQGVVHRGYEHRPLQRKRLDGFDASYVWVYTSSAKTARRRLLFYGSYAIAAAALGVARGRPDVVFASSPPLPVGAVGALVARRHGIPWVFDVRDLWPEAAVAVGEMSEGRLLNLAQQLEAWLYEDAAAITTVTRPFVERIATKTSTSKLHLLPNGTTRLWVEGSALAPEREKLGLPANRFLWTYAGNVGPAQGLSEAVDAAGRLGADYHLLILGDGASRSELERQAERLAPGLVTFKDQVSPAEAVHYLRASDALLVPLADHPSLASFVPSKLFDFCAVGRPVIVAAAGEPHALVEASGAALAVPPGDGAALEQAVSRLRTDERLREQLAAAGRAFGAANLRDRHVDRLAEILESVRRNGSRAVA